MEYGLLPTEAALSFIIILFIIYIRKHQFNSTKTNLFKMYLRFLLIYFTLLCCSILILKYFGQSIVFVILWRVTHIFFVCSWFTFLYYSYTNIFDIKKEKFIDIVKHNFITKLVFVVMIILCLIFILPVSIPLLDFRNPIDPNFLAKPQSIITMVITILSNVSIIVSVLVFVKKGERKRLLPNVLAGIFAIPFAGMHIVCLETALYPLSLSVIAYILYFSYENPDILLLAQTKKFDEEAEVKTRIEFLESFNDEKYINKFPAKKHDHFLIPAGTIHCSGRNAMVLEISATPYIFTFKLWDWDRLGLDGLPRPVHINHGQHVIQFDRDTTWVKNNLVNNFVEMEDGSTKTGLHEREFIETRRYFFNERIKMNTMGSVNMNNLVEGEAAVIEPINNEFDPFIVHYAETFIIPEHIKEYYIRPLNENQKCGVIKAYVR